MATAFADLAPGDYAVSRRYSGGEVWFLVVEVTEVTADKLMAVAADGSSDAKMAFDRGTGHASNPFRGTLAVLPPEQLESLVFAAELRRREREERLAADVALRDAQRHLLARRLASVPAETWERLTGEQLETVARWLDDAP